MSYALQVQHVRKEFAGHVAVDDVSFEVPKGSIFGFLGPNGAGKTTTLRMINDIIRPDKGGVTILEKFSPGENAARHIGYLPEERGMYPKMRVIDALTFFAELRGLTAKEGKQRGMAWLERLELTQWARKKMQDLSKGMQQKIQFVTAVIHDPELLILDEPWSGLDPINAELLQEIVAEQNAKGKTILFSTHRMEHAEQLCDHACIIVGGKIVANGPLQELLDSRDTRCVRVAVPEGEMIELPEWNVISYEGQELVVELGETKSASQLASALLKQGISFRELVRIRPTLHKVFVDSVRAAENTSVEGGTNE